MNFMSKDERDSLVKVIQDYYNPPQPKPQQPDAPKPLIDAVRSRLASDQPKATGESLDAQARGLAHDIYGKEVMATPAGQMTDTQKDFLRRSIQAWERGPLE